MAIFTIQQALRYGQDRLQLTICELKTKQNIMITMTQPFLNIFLFANNCSNGKNLHIVRFIHIVYSWMFNAINSSNMNNLNLFKNFQVRRKIFKDKMFFKNQGHTEFW